MPSFQGSLERRELKETPVFQVETCQVNQEKEEILVSQVPQDQWELRDHLEVLDVMAFPELQVKYEETVTLK